MSSKSHKQNNSQAKVIIGIFVIITIGIIGMFIFGGSSRDDNSNSSNSQTNGTVVTEDASGKQIIDITAKGGYSPRVINAKANKETILKVSTKNTFDCSSALRIPALDYSKNLPNNGVTEINISADKAKGELVGTCSMGMYSFKINFT